MFFSQPHDFQDPDDKSRMDEDMSGPVVDIFSKNDHKKADQSHVERKVDVHQPETNTGIPPIPDFGCSVFEIHFFAEGYFSRLEGGL
jgi:hypothetical protein